MRKKWRGNIFSGCLVGRIRGIKVDGGLDVFSTSPPKYFISKLEKKQERKGLD